jgi:hypothetical protein
MKSEANKQKAPTPVGSGDLLGISIVITNLTVNLAAEHPKTPSIGEQCLELIRRYQLSRRPSNPNHLDRGHGNSTPNSRGAYRRQTKREKPAVAGSTRQSKGLKDSWRVKMPNEKS